jgi:endonuclease/exonuclease/phosphatase family metal-dependent hydrolase
VRGRARALCFLTAATLACATSRSAVRYEPIGVLVYNIHAGKDAAGGDNLERVAAVVRSTGADIVFLQEVDRRTTRSAGVDHAAELARLTGFQMAFGKSLDYQGGEYGIAILSRWPITEHKTFDLPVDPPQERAGGSHEPRAALQATISAPGGPIAVLNTHLDASREDRWRRQEIAKLISIASDLRSRAQPLLVGGDLNSTPESAVQEEARAAGYTDAWMTCGAGAGLTYPADSGVKRIDYLYLSGGQTCESATVIETQASDHRPLLVKLRLRRSP